MGQPEIKSTAQQLEDFVAGNSSFIWEDILHELENWKEDVWKMYPEAQNMFEKGKIDGRLEALAYFIAMPSLLLEARREATLNRENFTLEDEEPEEF